jgi:hypothetical protein
MRDTQVATGGRDGMTTLLREAETAYRNARYWARPLGTIRLRFVERRLRGRVDRLTQPEKAYLAGIRHELRDRGVEVRVP